MASRKHRKPKQLAASIGRLTGGIYRKRGFPEAKILSDWRAIVGPALAKVTMPERLSANGVLKVRVAGPQATELTHLEPEILERVAVYYGYRAARRLSFVQGPITPPAAEPVISPRATPSPTAVQSVERQVARTDDPDLKSALAALGRAVVSRQEKAK